jgi:molybdopterin-guanine dinucleotide biosynthesis protein A
VVAGPRRPVASTRPAAPTRVAKGEGVQLEPHIVWTQEQPAGSGPASALMHALSLVVRPVVVVLAVDVPFAAAAIARVLAALPGYDAAMLIDEAGRRQPLLAAYRTRALRRRAEDGAAAENWPAAENGGAQRWANRSMRSLVEGMRVAEVQALGVESMDCDTPDDLARARLVAARLTAAQAAGRPAPDTSRTKRAD